MFTELLAHPGVEEELVLRSRFGFMAFHGGNLERMTDVVAEAAAEMAGASCYSVRQPDDLHWHIPSNEVGRYPSPALLEFAGHVEVAVSVHGYGREGLWTTLLLGGQNRALAEHVGGHLREHLGDYEVATELDNIPSALRGMHRHNPVNLPIGRGVQVELPPRVRGMGPVWAHWTDGHSPPTRALIAGLADAARTWTASNDPS